MSYCPTASTALEHDTARRLESRDSSGHGSLDRGRLLLERTIALAAAVGGPPPDAAASGENASGADAPNGVLQMTPGAVLDPAREALERTCLTVKRIAHDIGMPRATLEAYRLGTRRMPQMARVRLGTYLAAHAAMLDGLAQSLIAPPTVADV